MLKFTTGDERTELGVALANLADLRVKLELLIEPIRRQFDDRTAAFEQKPPILLKIVGAWQSASHSDNCDGDTFRPRA